MIREENDYFNFSPTLSVSIHEEMLRKKLKHVYINIQYYLDNEDILSRHLLINIFRQKISIISILLTKCLQNKPNVNKSSKQTRANMTPPGKNKINKKIPLQRE